MNITGRDDYVKLQALAYAIAFIQSLPEDRQEQSNMRDMCAILRKFEHQGLTSAVLGSVYVHTGNFPDLWPDEDDLLSPDEIRRKKEYHEVLVPRIREEIERSRQEGSE